MINDKGEIKLKATVKENDYRVISTNYGKGSSVWFAEDTILNETTGKKITKTRKQWKIIFDKFK